MRPLGEAPLGTVSLATGNGNLPNRSTKAWAVTYSVSTGYANAWAVTYSVQANTAGAWPIYYTVGGSVTTFTINGTSVEAPSGLLYHPPQTVGYDQSGVPVTQGYLSVDWIYPVLSDAEIKTFMTLYDPNHPEVTITYPNELGLWVQKVAFWQPPEWGTRSTVMHQQVKLTFTHIESD